VYRKDGKMQQNKYIDREEDKIKKELTKRSGRRAQETVDT
jgi:hypothetical protein